MAAANFDACFAILMKEEGGYVDNPKDPGGATNHGVTLDTWRTFVGRNKVVTVADIKALTTFDVVPLYRVFWKGCAADYLPAGIDLAAFDWCVNSGVKEGNMGLQRALHVPDDGLVGPVTLKAAAAADHDALVDAICDERLAFMETLPINGTLTQKMEMWAEFGHGWSNRVAAIRTAAKAMIAA